MPEDDERLHSAEAFEAALEALFQRAHAEGVEVDGAWECLSQAADPDWDVIVTELDRRGG